MKQILKTMLAIVGIAALTGFVSYRLGADRAVREAVTKRDALEWLKTDFHLNDMQFAAVRKLHESYSSVCEEHCRAIQEAMRERAALRARGEADPAAQAAADRRVQELRQICETAIARHVREVATHMPAAEGERYLALVLPKIADFDHRAAPDVRMSHRGH